jgi:CO/xanthine dehydrogenase Mo-binding subunit
MGIANIRVIPAEIGGGFGGKTLVYLEPLAVGLSKKSGRPVKMVMTREEVFRATKPTSGSTVDVKLGATREGRITAAQAVLRYQAGAFPGSPVQPGCMAAFAMYDLANVSITGYDVVCNRPKVAAYRAPGAPIASFAVESCMDELARALGMDPLALREKNAARDGTRTAYGPVSATSATRDRGGGQEARPLCGAPGAQPRTGRRFGLLVQRGRGVDGRGAH